MAASAETASGETSKKKKTERLWTDEEIELLITCYEERKCLWNFTANEYSNRDQKQLAFDSIDWAMSQFDITREDYKAKWKVLRGQYMWEVASEKKKNRPVKK